jgi:cytochrome c-type biogenesis protein CcmE
MKLTSIIGILVIGVIVAVIFSTSSDASSYVNFEKAKELFKNGDDDKVHVVGSLVKDKKGEILDMRYDPKIDPNYFSFALLDDAGKKCEVVYYNPKPQDFERSDKIVVIGAMKDKVFVADKILMKCPSKYEDNKLEMPAKKQQALVE